MENASSTSAANAPMNGDKSVLVIDDSRLQRRIVSTVLKKLGYKVEEAASGPEGLEKCQSRRFDLILTDWVMPEMTGPEFCEAFRSGEQDSYSYLILLTSKSGPDDIAKGLGSGADDFLSKPVNSAELRARIFAGQRIVAMQADLIEKNREVHNALEEIQRLYDLLDSDLQEAKKLQLSLLPEREKKFGPVLASSVLRSCGHVGGDLVGYFPINDDCFGFFSIDVSGHGVSSALMTSRLAGYLSGGDMQQNVAVYLDNEGIAQPTAPQKVVETLNRLMFMDGGDDLYFTAIYGVCDYKNQRVEFCQAGHPYPILSNATGKTHCIGEGGLPIGLVADATYSSQTVKWEKGSKLIFASDGFSEAQDSEGAMLEDSGMISLVKTCAHLKGFDFLEALSWHLADWANGRPPDDDISAVVLDFT